MTMSVKTILTMEEIPERCGALCLKRNDASFHVTILVLSKTKTDIESQKARRLVIKRLELEIQLAALRRRRCGTELAGEEEKLETSCKVERDFPHLGGTGYARERQDKHLDQKLQGKFEKRNRNTPRRKVWLKTPMLKTVINPGSGNL